MKAAYIFDLDGTLCDSERRYKKYISNGKNDWKKFYAHCDEDYDIFPVCETLRIIADAGFSILFVTGRPESARKKTLKWIREYFGRKVADTNKLFMRSADDGFRADYVSKVRNYRDHIQDNYSVIGVFEDRDQCVRAWRDLGLQCFQVTDGTF